LSRRHRHLDFHRRGKKFTICSAADLTGTYAARRTLAVAGGNTLTMKNERVTIVILKNEGQETGTQLSVGPAGMKITPDSAAMDYCRRHV
jgi:hypothetical protein